MAQRQRPGAQRGRAGAQAAVALIINVRLRECVSLYELPTELTTTPHVRCRKGKRDPVETGKDTYYEYK